MTDKTIKIYRLHWTKHENIFKIIKLYEYF